MKRNHSTPTTAPAPAPAAGDFAALATEWQRLATRAWSDLGRQADAGRAEVAGAQSPAQAWLLQWELLMAQATGMARCFEEALVAGLDLQTRWFKQFETLGHAGLQAWLPAEGRAGGAPTGAFGGWADWQQQMLSALRHDVEGARTER
jgi:hypothetical protein